MWETTFARLTHAGLGKDLTKRHACSAVCYLRQWACPIRRGYVYAPQTKMLEGRKNVSEWWNPDSGFRRKHFSVVRRPNRVLTPMKSASFENPDFIFCSSFQNLRLGENGCFARGCRCVAGTHTSHKMLIAWRIIDDVSLELTRVTRWWVIDYSMPMCLSVSRTHTSLASSKTNCAMSHPRLYEEPFIREYSTIRPHFM